MLSSGGEGKITFLDWQTGFMYELTIIPIKGLNLLGATDTFGLFGGLKPD